MTSLPTEESVRRDHSTNSSMITGALFRLDGKSSLITDGKTVVLCSRTFTARVSAGYHDSFAFPPGVFRLYKAFGEPLLWCQHSTPKRFSTNSSQILVITNWGQAWTFTRGRWSSKPRLPHPTHTSLWLRPQAILGHFRGLDAGYKGECDMHGIQRVRGVRRSVSVRKGANLPLFLPSFSRAATTRRKV